MPQQPAICVQLMGVCSRPHVTPAGGPRVWPWPFPLSAQSCCLSLSEPARWLCLTPVLPLGRGGISLTVVFPKPEQLLAPGSHSVPLCTGRQTPDLPWGPWGPEGVRTGRGVGLELQPREFPGLTPRGR